MGNLLPGLGLEEEGESGLHILNRGGSLRERAPRQARDRWRRRPSRRSGGPARTHLPRLWGEGYSGEKPKNDRAPSLPCDLHVLHHHAAYTTPPH
eukprot:6484115-Pyramimonas_sp.AAC.1